jgi:hypothetical protein
MERIRFLHIPKTAGTSFTDCLARIYPGEKFVFTGLLKDDFERYRAMEASERERIALISGHCPRITGIPEIDKLPIITLLRDPIEQVKSHCQHVSEGKNPYWRELYPPGTFELDEFLESGHLVLSNLQTKMLLGDEGYRPITGETRALVDEVLHVLQNDIVCFGIVEEFDTSLMWFRRRLGWKQWPVYRRLNVASESKRLTFSSDQIAKIRALNAVDIEVYARALDVFHAELARISDYLAANLEIFEQEQRLWALRLKAPSSAAPIEVQPSRTWEERVERAFHIARTEGLDALLQEIRRYIRWMHEQHVHRV